MSKFEEKRIEVTTQEARAGRIVKGGAMVRILAISTVLAVAVLLVAYLVLAN